MRVVRQLITERGGATDDASTRSRRYACTSRLSEAR
jgi:hypothetical protein